eukprot:7380368-Prymnesium_polylepis.1
MVQPSSVRTMGSAPRVRSRPCPRGQTRNCGPRDRVEGRGGCGCVRRRWGSRGQQGAAGGRGHDTTLPPRARERKVASQLLRRAGGARSG